MNVQAHVSGHFSGQVSQASNQLPGLPQMNGNSFHPQMQNLSGQSNPSMMDAEVVRIRKFMTERIFRILLKKQTPPTEMFARRCQDLSRRLEEGLFRSAASKEAYMNLNTLELRLHALVKRPASTNHVPQHSQFLNTSTPVGTMIPTPGLHHNGNSSVITSTTVDQTMITASTGGSTSTSIPTAGGLMPNVNGSFSGMRGGSFRSAEGTFSNGYQQSASSFPTGVGNVMVGQRPVSQMIPTPGYSGSNNQTLTNTENSNNGVTFSSVDSSVVSQKVSQKVPQRYASDQNGQMSQNLGNGMRSLHQQQFQNDTSNSGFGNAFGASTRSLLQPNDQHHQPAVQGDSSASGDLYNTGTSVGSLVNNQNGNQVRTSSTSRPSSLMTSQSTTQSTPSGSYIRPHVAEHAEKSKFQSSTSTRENHSQSSMGQFQQQPHQVPQQQHFTSHRQQRHSTELSQASVRNGGFQSQSMFGVGSLVKRENGLEGQSDDFQPQNSAAQIQVAELESQHQYNSNGNLPRNPQSSSCPSATHSTHLSNPQPMMVDEKANGFDGLSVGAQPDALLHRSWQSDADRLRMAAKLSDEQLVQEEFQQRIVGHEEAQRIHFSSEVPSNGQIVASGSIMNQHQSGGAVGSLNDHRNQHYRNQLRWLLFLYHARWCKAPAGKCPERNCITVQQLLRHMDNCNAVNCLHPRCALTRRLLAHNKHCRDMNCPVCIPYRKFIQAQKKLCAHQDSIRLETLKSLKAGEAKAKETIRPLQPVIESSENQPSVKRLKSEQPSQSLTSGNGIMSVRNVVTASHVPNNVRSHEYEKYDTHNNLLVKYEHLDMKAEISSSSNQKSTEIKNAANDISSGHELDGGSVLKDINSSRNDEAVKLEKDNGQSKTKDVVVPSEQGPVMKSEKPMIKGVSLIELFTPEQVREHITGLRQWVGQSKAKVEKILALEQTMNENSCQLCAVEKLSFEPPPLYCTPCGARIKRNAMYYTAGAGDTRHYFCIPCYNEARGDVIQVDGKPMSKSRMAKRKNDEETEEGWVQCDRCEAWQHQICALFNGKRNDGGQADYTCPNCYLEEVERGERQPLPQNTVLGAKDLPGTALSDHIEQRLAKRLKQERQERARSQGKSFDEVPGVEGVVVRVVSSVDKKLEVKPRFLEIFREENYPLEFPYKSKVVLLFQKIEGVEVCLYGMYVQEFGSECLPPNQRRVYLSYLDSVKYFRPDVKAVTGEALRTFVYHEILIGYLEYCKKRGFASCYIWACPPLKGEDYILYCHPEIQKTPKSDKLREWYLAMLRKASRENIVVELTNLYDHFFTQSGECKAKVTAARLPYFDGDYWPGAAEDMIDMIYQEEECRKLNKKGATKKIITKRALKASGQLDLSTNASKDVLLMLKLGETIAPMKEDFIMVHLQHACTHCCMLMVSGNRWVCELCKRFQLCDRCYDEETKRDDRDRHPINQKDKHVLKKIEITDVPEDTKDEDEILESEFFDTRQAFLSLCQGNHYQYDTLRRAKHSSMMMLYHLHNPTAPAFVTTCNICHLDIETGQGWRCETCPEYDVCNSCYQKDGGTGHPHKLTHHPSIAERDAQNKEARQQRVVQLRKMLDLLVHASQCRIPPCKYPNCQKVKALFRHGIQCQLRAFRGCNLCKRMWYLLQLHARACKESACHVPRCRDLREHLRRLQQQSDSRRRTAVMEMMRQRAKEVSGNA